MERRRGGKWLDMERRETNTFWGKSFDCAIKLGAQQRVGKSFDPSSSCKHHHAQTQTAAQALNNKNSNNKNAEKTGGRPGWSRTWAMPSEEPAAGLHPPTVCSVHQPRRLAPADGHLRGCFISHRIWQSSCTKATGVKPAHSLQQPLSRGAKPYGKAPWSHTGITTGRNQC